MIRILTLLCALLFVTPAVACDGKVNGKFRIGATVVIKDNQLVNISRVTIIPTRRDNDDSIDINIGPLDIHIPQDTDAEACEPVVPLCEGGICIAPRKKPEPVAGPDGKPQRVYMIYHPKKEKYLGVGLLGGFVNWVGQDEAIILPNKKSAQEQVDKLLGSKRSVVLKAFLLLPVAVR